MCLIIGGYSYSCRITCEAVVYTNDKSSIFWYMRRFFWQITDLMTLIKTWRKIVPMAL